MKILNPKDNIGRIISLVENAKEFITIVSPFSYLEGWDKLKQAINEASKRGIRVDYYVRKEQGDKGLEELQVTIFEVENLHAKMFFNEQEAIISSFHLMNNQDINWAFVTNDSIDYSETINFFDAFIKPKAEELNHLQ